jgi:hypothetical protein
MTTAEELHAQPDDDDEDYDPPAHERAYYRDKDTGDLGYIVRRGGTDVIRLDRPFQEIVATFTSSSGQPLPRWVPEVALKRLNDHQVGKVAFEADKQLCFSLGLHEEARKEWMNLTDKERIRFLNKGPKGDPLRRDLYQAIRALLARVT